CAQHLSALPAPIRRIAALLTMTSCATIATFPITAFHFQNVTLLGLLVNLFAVPLVAGLALPIALAALPFVAWWPSLAGLFLNIAAFLLEQTLAFGRLLHDSLPMLGGRCALLPHEVFGLALALAVLLCPWKKRASAALLILALGLAVLPAKSGSTLPIVTVLSVGQGDATLLSLADGHYLVDGGGLRSSTFDTGERLVAPALTRLGIRHLRAVILTHKHPDHYLGLIHILRHMQVDAFWAASEDLPEPIPEILRQRGIPLKTFAPGWNTLPTEPGATFAIFAPGQQAPRVNDRSLVLFFGKQNVNVLLTGDLESEGVRELLNASPGLEAALLKLPHHGSASSAPDLLMNALRPRQLFVSSGKDNRHHLPHPKTLREAERRNLPLARTDLEGTVRFLWTPQGWQKQRWQNGLFR
ncbi:MAG: ComEC/Rec2 family competence protein, partial [Deltaproteobacteria bacterium]|nr:ComEC/Rec2 family competence protein [Deltaproteobacteria bacterium]